MNTEYADFKVVVADNASTDDSLAFLRTSFPHVQVIVLDQNYGFAGGYNRALKQVNAAYYVLLNSDVEVTQNWLAPMIALLEENEASAACQPKILSYQKKEMFEYAGAAGGWLDLYGYPFARGRVFGICEADKGQYNTTREIFWASGAALLIRANVFHQLNGFDEFFFAHQEEIDLCWRLHRYNYKVYCCPESVVYHVGGGTLPKGDSKKTFLNFRNNHILMARNMPFTEKWWKIPLRILLDQFSGFKGLLTGDAGYFFAIIKAHLAFLKWLFIGKKETVTAPRKHLSSIPGVYKGNIAWQHFVCEKTSFTQIVENKQLNQG